MIDSKLNGQTLLLFWLPKYPSIVLSSYLNPDIPSRLWFSINFENVTAYLHLLIGHESLSELHEGEARGVPQFVAEEAVALHTQHVQVDVATYIMYM